VSAAALAPPVQPRAKRVIAVFGKSFDAYQGRYLRAYNQAVSLVEAGYDVTVVGWDRDCNRPVEEERDGIHIRRFRIPAGGSRGPLRNAGPMLEFNRAVYRYLRRNPCDVIHCFDLDAMVACLAASRRQTCKAVLDISEPDYYKGFWKRGFEWLLPVVNWAERTCARRFDHVFVNTTYQVRKFENRGLKGMTMLGCYPRRSMVLDTLPEKPPGRVAVGYLGTMYANKGIEELVAAFGLLLARERAEPSGYRYELVLAGKVLDNFRPTLERLIAPFREHVRLTGPYDIFTELPGLYRSIDISVLVYDVETFANLTPTKLYESLANGVPVIANDIGDMGEVVRAGQCGVVVASKTPEVICDAIQKFAASDQLLRRTSERCLELAQSRYSWEALRDAYLAAYAGLWR
jgi:glycosyltransferase involved in cell wall biosynthesis